ncbi:uncharacterized protein UTRI_02900 [Ustilago trichophora]|uniref:tRNA-splicing endonuclease subunit Sen15 domain-containing protein n=1 Tax=Ustilago trichophora TaxID=86804 RepID=A0A5C3EP57_9BASI|nr:uncharacterized protein UTRI_02900 [Ustilago trichophora]
MASTSTNSTATSSRNAASSLPEATSRQLSKRQQYDTMLNAEAGQSSSSTSLGSPSSHPSYPAVAPLCRRYPTQASAVFQTYLDLKNGAAAWDTVEPIALSTPPQSHLGAPNERVEKDLSSLSDAEAEALVQERLEALKKRVARLGLVNSSGKGAEGEQEEEEEELLKAGLAAIKGRRKDAKAYEIVIPLTITQHLRASQFKAIFTLIDAHAATCPSGEQVDTSHVLLAIIAPDSTLVYYLVSQGMVKPIN